MSKTIEESTKEDVAFLATLPLIWYTKRVNEKACIEICTLVYWREWYYSAEYSIWMHRMVDPKIISNYINRITP
jgi:hypothetical protein